MEQEQRKSLVKSTGQKQTEGLQVFKATFEKACYNDIFKPAENGEALFKAMVCGLTPEEETDFDTKGKQLEPDILPMLHVFFIAFKKQAEQNGIKLNKDFHGIVKCWVNCNPEIYDKTRKTVQALINFSCVDVGYYGELASETIQALIPKGNKAIASINKES